MPAARIPNPDLLPARIRKNLCVLTGNCWFWKPESPYVAAVGATLSANEDPSATLLAENVIFEHFRRPIPEGKTLTHLCGNDTCCNPDHLDATC